MNLQTIKSALTKLDIPFEFVNIAKLDNLMYNTKSGKRICLSFFSERPNKPLFTSEVVNMNMQNPKIVNKEYHGLGSFTKDTHKMGIMNTYKITKNVSEMPEKTKTVTEVMYCNNEQKPYLIARRDVVSNEWQTYSSNNGFRI